MTETTETLTIEQACTILGIEPDELVAAVKAKCIIAASRNPDRFRPVDLLKGYPRWVHRGRTGDECAAHLGIDRRTFLQHVADGNISRKPNKGYDLATVTAEYCQHLRNASQGQAGGELSEARAGLTRIKTERELMEIARERGELVPLSALIDLPLGHLMGVTDLLESLGGRICAALGKDPYRDPIREIVDEQLDQLWMELAGAQDAITNQDVPALTTKYRLASMLVLLEDGKAAINDAFPDASTAVDGLLLALRSVLKVVGPQYLTEQGKITDQVRHDIYRERGAARRTLPPKPYRRIPARISGLGEVYEVIRGVIARKENRDAASEPRHD